MYFEPFDKSTFEDFLREANTKPDYNTNAGSYYKDLARKNHLIELLSKRIWEYDVELAKRFEEWAKNLESFDDDVLSLLQEWMDDGTFDHIINETIFEWKADKVDLDKTNRNVNDRFINVKSPPSPLLPAVGDGITDDTEAIQEIINTGYGVYFPDGIYLISKTLTTPNENFRLVGSGFFNSILKTNENITMIEAVGSDQDIEKVFIKDIQLDGNGLASTGIRFHKIQNDSLLENIFVQNINGVGIDYDGWNWTGSIIRSRAWHCETGIRLGPGSNEITIDDTNIFKCDTGIEVVGGTSNNRLLSSIGTRIINSVFQSITNSAIELSLENAEIGMLTINENYFEQVGIVLKGTRLPDYTWGVVKVLSFEHNTVMMGEYGFNPKTYYIELSPLLIRDVKIDHNFFGDGEKVGKLIHLSNESYNITITDNSTVGVTSLYEGGYDVLTRENNQYKNFSIETGTTRPLKPRNSQIFYDNNLKKLLIYNDNRWMEVSSKEISTSKTDFLVKTTNLSTVDQLLPNVSGNFAIYLNYRTNVECTVSISVTYQDTTGNPRTLPIATDEVIQRGVYTPPPILISARGSEGEPIKINVTVNEIDTLRISTVIKSL